MLLLHPGARAGRAQEEQMRDTYLAVAGVVATDPTIRTLDDGRSVMSFRMASTSRRYDSGSKMWIDGQTLWVKVSCWRELAANAAQCVRKRDRVVAWGRIKTEQWKTKEGGLRSDLALDAEAMGHDLTFGVAAFDRKRRAVSTQVLTGEPPVNVATGEIIDAEAEAVMAGDSLLDDEAASMPEPELDGELDDELDGDVDDELDGDVDEEDALEAEVNLVVPA
jgi:single-strand DNA-binding protein